MKPGYKQTEVGVIPEEWEVCPVCEKGEVLTGKALAVNAPGQQRPYFRTKNVFDGRIETGDVLTMPMTDEQFAQFRIRKGDVLLNEGQSLELVGRCAIYQDEYPEPCAIQNALLRFRARAGVSEKYASYLFRHCQQTGVFARIALQTTSVAHLGGSRFARLHLAWPTKNEQRAIAAALSDLDGLLGGLERLVAKKRNLKQAAMHQLLTGQTRLPGFSGAWVVKTLGEIVETDPENLGSSTSPHYSFKYVSLEDVDCGNLRGCAQQVFATAPSRARRKLRSNDVLVSTVRPNLLSHFFFQSAESNWVCSTGFCVLRCREGISHAGYIFQHLFAAPVIRQIEALLTGSNYPSMNSRDVRAVEIPLPPLPEQTAIAAVLTDMDAELAALEHRREKTRALKQGMMQELLTGRTRLV